MPINLRNLQDITNNIKADVQNALPLLDPSIEGSAIKVIVETLGARSFDNRQLISQLIQQSFPQTATDEFLELLAAYDGLIRNAATISTGFLTVVGTIGVNVPGGSVLNSQSNIILKTKSTVTISNLITSISSLTFSGGVVTATCITDHSLSNGVAADIIGADQSEYNGTFVVTAISNTVFEYVPITPPSITPATGVITVDFDGTVIEVESQGAGLNQNIGTGSSASFSSPITGVNTTAIVRIPGIEGGTDLETDDNLRLRLFQKRSSIQSLFNSSFLIETAKTVAGVTRVFVKEITLGVVQVIGATTVYFMRDGDINPIPSGIDITNVNNILQAVRPAQMIETDFLILAPTGVPVAVSLNSLVPDTPTMRSNIQSVLAEFFSFQVDFEKDIIADKIKAALFNSQDVETGQFLQSFALTSPAADITINAGEIGTLGTITIT